MKAVIIILVSAALAVALSWPSQTAPLVWLLGALGGMWAWRVGDE